MNAKPKRQGRVREANFNETVERIQENLDIAMRGILLAPKWTRYQFRRTRESYLPAFLRHGDKRKNLVRIFLDLAEHWVRWGCLPIHYLRYGLYRNSIDRATAFSFIPETVAYYRVFPRINRQAYLLDSKIVSRRILAAIGVPQARRLVELEHGKLWVNQAVTSALAARHDEVVCKPAAYGSGGKGIVLADSGILRAALAGDAGAVRAALGCYDGDWIIDEKLDQVAALSALHTESLNSLRVMTFFHERSGAEVVCCMLKCGAGGARTDNAHTGGVYVAVDLGSGQLAHTAYDEDLRSHSAHPTTQRGFADVVVPKIADVVAVAIRAANAFPTLRLVGWDVAVTPDGPVVLEGNSSPGLTIVQRTHGGFAPVLAEHLRRMRDG